MSNEKTGIEGDKRVTIDSETAKLIRREHIRNKIPITHLAVKHKISRSTARAICKCTGRWAI